MPAVHTRLYLARHCDVRNPEGVLYGYLPNFPLSDLGRRQAEALGAYLAERAVRTIAASPLERAQETAAIIARHVGVPVQTDEDLVEAKFGIYLQGVKPAQVPWRRPLWFVHLLFPGLLRRDETVPAMAARVRAALVRMLREHPGESGLCISHGDPIQAFWVEATGRSRYALHRLDCAKGGMLELDYFGEELQKVTYLPPQAAGAEPARSPAIDHSHA